MKNSLEDLNHFLSKLKNLNRGDKISCEFDFSVFTYMLNIWVERGDKRITKPLEVLLWKKEQDKRGYEISGKDKRHILISNQNWEISGGIVNPDNLRGEHFLKIPVDNSVKNTEARLYVSRSDSVYSI